MLTGTVDLSVGLGIVALIVTLAGLSGVGVVVLSRRAEATSALQSDTITALEAANTLKGEQLTVLRRDMETDRDKCAAQLAAQQQQIDGLQEQVTILKELVTQKAHVEALRDEIDVGFQGVHKKIDRLMDTTR